MTIFFHFISKEDIFEEIKNLNNSKKATNNKDKAFGALLTNLSKAFVYRSDDLLIANFHANNLDLLSRT